MRLTARPLISVPVLLALAAAAFLVMWAWGPAGGAGVTESGRINSNLEYTVRDAFGAIKSHGLLHNATSANLLADAEDRLSATVNVLAADVYTGLAICSNNTNNGAVDGFTPNATLCTLITAVTEANPKTAATVNAGTATYNIVQLFTATGAITITELQLVKNPVDTTQPVVGNIGAAQDVNITMATSDTLTITWTVTIS